MDRAVLAQRRRWARVALVLVVLFTGSAASWVVSAAVDRAEQRYAARLMDRYAEDVNNAINTEVTYASNMLSDLAAAIGVQSNFTATDFEVITSGLNRQRLPGASGVAFIVASQDRQVADLQTTWRAQGQPGLRLAPVGVGVEHLFAVFGRSFDGVPSTTGRDVSQAPEPAEALRTSRSSGMFTVSRSYVLLKDRSLPVAQQQLSFSLVMPVFRQRGTLADNGFIGWVQVGMRGGDFLDRTLQTEARGAVGVVLTDRAIGTSRTVASVEAGKLVRGNPLNRERTLAIGERAWEMQIYPTVRLLNATDRRMADLSLGGGLLVTLLLTALVGILSGARNRAMAQVDEATGALRRDIERRRATEARLREREQELQHLAFHDPLTGLANRALFYDRVEHALLVHRRAQSPFAVLFIDLDGFKQVNDTLGHSAGDAVLREVATRLRNCMRASDTIARFGGDEFAVIAEHLVNGDDVQITADRIVRAMEPVFDIENQSAAITASVGVALHRPGDSADDVLHAADVAMYTAKTAGKGRYVLAGSTPLP